MHSESIHHILKELINIFDSDDIFIKSIEYLAPSTVEKDVITFPNVFGNVVIVFLGFENISSLRLTLNGVRSMCFDFKYEIVFSAIYDEYERTYNVNLNRVSTPIICQQLTFIVD